MGGSRDPATNTPANGVLLCTHCHRWVESHRDQAFSDGWLVRQGHDPAAVSVLYHGARGALLTPEGLIVFE
ncbi:hypothetical protein FHT44_004935 [Mycolicibacterium sp. BK634]|nr:hypothetical protein [Mycolicibacterium sp. BK634]